MPRPTPTRGGSRTAEEAQPASPGGRSAVGRDIGRACAPGRPGIPARFDDHDTGTSPPSSHRPPPHRRGTAHVGRGRRTGRRHRLRWCRGSRADGADPDRWRLRGLDADRLLPHGGRGGQRADRRHRGRALGLRRHRQGAQGQPRSRTAAYRPGGCRVRRRGGGTVHRVHGHPGGAAQPGRRAGPGQLRGPRRAHDRRHLRARWRPGDRDGRARELPGGGRDHRRRAAAGRGARRHQRRCGRGVTQHDQRLHHPVGQPRARPAARLDADVVGRRRRRHHPRAHRRLVPGDLRPALLPARPLRPHPVDPGHR